MVDKSKPYSPRLNSYEGDKIFDSRIDNIDSAMFNFIDKQMDLSVKTNTGFRKVPVIMTSAERSRLSKSQIRDRDGALVLPLITIERTAITKSPTEKGTVYANVPPIDSTRGGSIPTMQKIMQPKTANFKNAHSLRTTGQLNFPTKVDKTVYQVVTIPLPVYISVEYEITLRTEYQQQMNELVIPFITVPGGINYLILRDGVHRYEAFVQESFAQSNNINNFTNEARKFETKFNIKVLGHVMGAGDNQESPHQAIRETIVEVKIPREKMIVDPEELSKYGL
tara:strand:+ start:358 stop:1200 length:843 start_codon:yes stop_codon:yes gene_type:complete